MKYVVKAFFLVIFVTTLSVFAYPPEYDSIVAQEVVDSLDFTQFKAYIKSLADLGHRAAGTSSNRQGKTWIQNALKDMGYKNVTLQSKFNNVYCTKEGSVSPDSMYIISAHYDGVSRAESANDDASGCALLLEGARVLINPEFKTHYSLRFAFWNEEETGLKGARAYVDEKRKLQGTSEPVWLGMVQHDMILYDHGMPPKPQQIPDADMDVEYQKDSQCAQQSLALAKELFAGAEAYAKEYAADIGDNMKNTDSEPFKNYIAAVSVRDLERIKEIGNGADPTWHTSKDRYDYFSEKDFRLGFNTVQMTIGTMMRLTGVHKEPTSMKPKPILHLKKQPSLSSVVKEIKVFDLTGKIVLTQNSLENWRNYLHKIDTQKILPRGLYVFQLTDSGTKAQHRFLMTIILGNN